MRIREEPVLEEARLMAEALDADLWPSAMFESLIADGNNRWRSQGRAPCSVAIS
jgi:hypothetical protein